MIFLVALCLVTTSFALPNNAQAGDLTRTGLGDIVDMWRTPDGNICAMDTIGSIAEFDYSKWTRIRNGTLGSFGSYKFITCSHSNGVMFDSITNTYLLNQSNNYRVFYADTGELGPIFNLQNNKEIPRGMFFGVIMVAEENTISPATSNLEVKYYDFDGNLVHTITKRPGGNNPNIVGFNPMTGHAMIKYRMSSSDNRDAYVVAYFDLESFSPQTIDSDKKMSKILVDDTYYMYEYKGGIYTSSLLVVERIRHSSSRLIIEDGWLSPSTISEAVSSGRYYTRAGLMATFDNGKVIIDGKMYDVNKSASPINPTAAVIDKYGNLILGGEKGKVLVINASTEYITDSAYYLADGSQYAKEARDAALLAKEFAQSAESKASEVVDQLKGITPTIISVQATNAATATKNNTINLTVNATNASEYRIGKEGVFKNWQSSPELVSPLLSYGANTLILEAKRTPDGGVTRSTITIFKIQ